MPVMYLDQVIVILVVACVGGVVLGLTLAWARKTTRERAAALAATREDYDAGIKFLEFFVFDGTYPSPRSEKAQVVIRRLFRARAMWEATHPSSGSLTDLINDFVLIPKRHPDAVAYVAPEAT